MTGEQRQRLRQAIDQRQREALGAPADGVRHGQAAAYRSGCRCAECRSYEAGYRQRLRLRGQVRTHNVNGYKNGCRCEICSTAMRDFRRLSGAA